MQHPCMLRFWVPIFAYHVSVHALLAHLPSLWYIPFLNSFPTYSSLHLPIPHTHTHTHTHSLTHSLSLTHTLSLSQLLPESFSATITHSNRAVVEHHASKLFAVLIAGFDSYPLEIKARLLQRSLDLLECAVLCCLFAFSCDASRSVFLAFNSAACDASRSVFLAFNSPAVDIPPLGSQGHDPTIPADIGRTLEREVTEALNKATPNSVQSVSTALFHFALLFPMKVHLRDRIVWPIRLSISSNTHKNFIVYLVIAVNLDLILINRKKAKKI